MTDNIICKNCGGVNKANNRFCAICGGQIHSETITTSVETSDEGRFGKLRSKMKLVGGKAQKITEKASDYVSKEKATKVVSKAKEVTKQASGVVSEEKASEAVKNMVGLMIDVAKNVRKDIPPKMVKAIDLSAEISFIAFSIGVSIDLEYLEISEVDVKPLP